MHKLMSLKLLYFPLLNFYCDLNISSGGFVYCQMWISPNSECKNKKVAVEQFTNMRKA